MNDQSPSDNLNRLPAGEQPTDHATRDRELFDRIAGEYCRKDLLPASRAARRHRLLQTLQAVPFSQNASVLEVGCGAGFAAQYLQGHIDDYCGVDYSTNLIEYAREFNGGPGIQFVAQNIQEFLPGRSFDLIFAIGLLHHLDNLDATLAALVQLLKPGGWLVANEPQPANPVISFARTIRKRIDANYSSDQRELSSAELQAACSRAGLTDIRLRPQGLFSTPFAEVPLSPQWLTTPCAKLACWTDGCLEHLPAWLLNRLTWNLIIAGQKPESTID
ncbi:MAG: class I SAM-dependent methyltransferase [Gimesia chilikensis]|uniref:class I SAM-dependent methyltransferase n=1 Tax=Gimesia chilikensis TaxID=2605989 RepID=UPI0037AE2C84